MAVQNSVVPNEVPTEASDYVSLLEAKVAALEAENSSLAQRLESIVSAPAAPAPTACPEPAEWQQKEQLYLKLVDRLQAEVSRLSQTLAEHQAAAASAAEHAVAGVAQELLQVPALGDAMLSSLRTIPNASISEVGCECQTSSSHFPRNACSVSPLCAQQLKDYSAKHGTDAAMLFSSMNPPLFHSEAHQSYGHLCFAPPSGLVNGGVWKGPSSGQPLPPRKSVSSMEPLCDVASMSSMPLLPTGPPRASRFGCTKSRNSSVVSRPDRILRPHNASCTTFVARSPITTVLSSMSIPFDFVD
eukprot:TRINITY_DN3312_c0_g1_i1.p1 TRINITY_DN3312_c0_g1~~TRINITY_DN3312_c0_g1_i1.p1  ORF type:complete len:336 (-),score=19.12 TRINITY_DN3312_c0_g1_i1:64-966(-)